MKDQPLYFYLQTREENRCSATQLEITLTIVAKTNDDAPTTARLNHTHKDPHRGLDSLRWTCTAYAEHPDWDNRLQAELCNLNGQHPGAASAAAATYKHICAGLDRLERTAGPSPDAGADAQRLAAVLKLSGIIRPSPRNPEHWQVLECSHIASVINRAIREYHQKHADATKGATAAAA